MNHEIEYTPHACREVWYHRPTAVARSLDGQFRRFHRHNSQMVHTDTTRETQPLSEIGCVAPSRAESTRGECHCLSGPTLDEVMRAAIMAIQRHGIENNATKGRHIELTGVLLEITNPRARLSRTETRGKPFSCLGELCWYLAKSNDIEFISYYIPKYPEYTNDPTLSAAYGPRFFQKNGIDQVANVIRILESKSTSRRAVIQLFDATDLEVNTNDVPCTCTLQFLVRNNKLHLITNMRSNDVVLGLPHDVFSFTMLQEIIACTLSVGLGSYKHFVGSLHYYCKDITQTMEYLDEQYQSTELSMPPMPNCDPWKAIQRLLSEECKLRLCGISGYHSPSDLDSYWLDLVNLLYIYRCSRSRNSKGIESTRSHMNCKVYDTYITRKLVESKSSQRRQGKKDS